MRHLAALVVLFALAAPAPAFDPVEKYTKREILGFTVLVHPEVEKHPDEMKAALGELEAQLKKVCEVVPEKPLAAIKKVKFWVEWETKKGGAMEAHHSRQWLKDNGYNPDKAGCVEINNAKNFVTWSQKTQPWMVLHELSHQYHHLTLGADYAPLVAAYKAAMERKIYDSVEFVHGGKRKHYATTNHSEYFAEISEAYFGKNDFFPFTHDELAKHDPAGYEMLKKAWGDPVKPAAKEKAPPAPPEPMTPAQVFEQRIAPIFKSPNPSSCVQCHLSAVDLKNYIRPSSEETFRSLRDQGLIDLDKPEKSRILALIEMGKEDKVASLIHQKNRTAEYEAFAAWVKACCADKALVASPKLKEADLAKPARPVEVIRHARKDHLLESFTNTVWAMRFRCMNCHTEGAAKAKELAAEHGDRVVWFKAGGPEATLKYLMDSKLIDTKEPAKSLLLLKPLNDVKHGGGVKFLPGDEGYKLYRGFLEDYAKIVNDQYASASELPKKSTTAVFGTELWLKMTNTPPEWADKLVRVKVFAWDAAKKAWETEPIATTDRKVAGDRKLWQHSLVLLAPAGSERAKQWKEKPTLPEGKYLVRAYLDADGKLAKDWTSDLGASDFVGEAEITTSWPAGYGKMTALDAAKVKKP